MEMKLVQSGCKWCVMTTSLAFGLWFLATDLTAGDYGCEPSCGCESAKCACGTTRAARPCACQPRVHVRSWGCGHKVPPPSGVAMPSIPAIAFGVPMYSGSVSPSYGAPMGYGGPMNPAPPRDPLGELAVRALLAGASRGSDSFGTPSDKGFGVGQEPKDCTKRLDELESDLRTLEGQVTRLVGVLEDHKKQLADHENRLGALELRPQPDAPHGAAQR